MSFAGAEFILLKCTPAISKSVLQHKYLGHYSNKFWRRTKFGGIGKLSSNRQFLHFATVRTVVHYNVKISIHKILKDGTCIVKIAAKRIRIVYLPNTTVPVRNSTHLKSIHLFIIVSSDFCLQIFHRFSNVIYINLKI